MTHTGNPTSPRQTRSVHLHRSYKGSAEPHGISGLALSYQREVCTWISPGPGGVGRVGVTAPDTHQAQTDAKFRHSKELPTQVTLLRKLCGQLDSHLLELPSPAAEVASQGTVTCCHPSQLMVCHQPDSQAAHEVFNPGLSAAQPMQGAPHPPPPSLRCPPWAGGCRRGTPGGAPTACQLPPSTPISLAACPALSFRSGFLFLPLQGPRNERSRPQAAPRPPPAAPSPGRYRGRGRWGGERSGAAAPGRAPLPPGLEPIPEPGPHLAP